MRTWIAAVAGLAVLFSLPVHADHFHHRPYVSFGYNYGYGYGYPFGYYRPYYYPWFGPSVGVGVRVDRDRGDRTERASEGEKGALKMYVYPAAGQSKEQTSEDRYQCHVWAADQSGYDPTLGAGKKSEAQDYTRAFTACMEGRNYVVK